MARKNGGTGSGTQRRTAKPTPQVDEGSVALSSKEADTEQAPVSVQGAPVRRIALGRLLGERERWEARRADVTVSSRFRRLKERAAVVDADPGSHPKELPIVVSDQGQAGGDYTLGSLARPDILFAAEHLNYEAFPVIMVGSESEANRVRLRIDRDAATLRDEDTDYFVSLYDNEFALLAR